jgi:hypothetical protein
MLIHQQNIAINNNKCYEGSLLYREEGKKPSYQNIFFSLYLAYENVKDSYYPTNYEDKVNNTLANKVVMAHVQASPRKEDVPPKIGGWVKEVQCSSYWQGNVNV